jgi:hypothetical protein
MSQSSCSDGNHSACSDGALELLQNIYNDIVATVLMLQGELFHNQTLTQEANKHDINP